MLIIFSFLRGEGMPAVRQDSEAQALRLRRYWMAVAASTTLLFAVLALFLVSPTGFHLPTILVAGLFLYWFAAASGFYIVLRSGFNLRFADPSMTVPMMLAAIAAVSVVIYFTGPYRGLFVLFYLLALQFAQFKLRRTGFLCMALLCVALYTAASAAWWWTQAAGQSPLPWLLRVAVVLLVFFCFALIGSYLSELRQRLHDTLSALTTAHEKNGRLATTDHLTQALNRRAIMRLLAREKRLAESGGGIFSVCLADVDGLKCVNEAYGQVTGDKALLHLVRCLRLEMRESDIIGRYGGEEFLIVLPNANLIEAESIAERLRRAVEKSPLALDDGEHLPMTLSLGVVEYRASETVDGLVERIDRALHRAKAAGRNRVCSDALGCVNN